MFGSYFAASLLQFQYYEPGDAAHAKDRLDGYNLDGRNISVLYAQVSTKCLLVADFA